MVETITVIAVIIIVLLVVALAYAATRPDTFRVQRSTSIMALGRPGSRRIPG
jgi:hypothetical protein